MQQVQSDGMKSFVCPKRERGFYELYIKRLLDIVCSLIAIILFGWLYIIVAILVLIKLGPPVLFKQLRQGEIDLKTGNEKIFCMYKFRSMSEERDKDGNLLPDEVRLGKFGKALRATSLDELPEVINILKGDMSIVGPRPQLVRDMVFMTDKQRMRHTAKPGLSGLAQVNGRNDISWEEKLDWDLKYIEKVSFPVDVKIIFQTVIKAFLKQEGITDGDMATAYDYGDWLLKAGKVSREVYEEKQREAKKLLETAMKCSKNDPIEGWKFYNHAAVPICAPHENPNLKPLEDGSIWRLGKGILFARWTENFDCGYETKFWYVIKDKPFDISALKSKRRYEVTKGNRNFNVRQIEMKQHAEEMYEVSVAAYSEWPEKYRPKLDRESFIRSIESDSVYKAYGAFEINTDRLVGYAYLRENGRCLGFSVLRTDPGYEKAGINAAIISFILLDNEEAILKGSYICDGTRNINHETKFQDYLEKYFGFRKAYCKLNIVYARKIRGVIRILKLLRPLLKRLDNIGKIHAINSLLFMDTLAR